MLAGLTACAGCGAAPDDLRDGVLMLPPQLREVSGLVALDERTVVCVQDEQGALFFVDLWGERPPRVAAFGAPGDYEGLARVGDDYWVLRSDGMLLRLVAQQGGYRVAATHRLLLEHREFEGLCFDAPRGALLILPKDAVGSGKAERDQREVYAFEVATGRLLPAPAVSFRVKGLVEQAESRGIALPTRVTGKGKVRTELKFRGSELLAVPGTDELLLLSAVDHLLLRVDRAGQLLGATELDERVLPQPEGMTFLPDGRLLVASEGAGGPGRLCVVAWRSAPGTAR